MPAHVYATAAGTGGGEWLSSCRGTRVLGKPVVAKLMSARSQRLHQHRLGMLRIQRAPELLGTPRPQHPKRNVGSDPPAKLNITAGSCATCHMLGQENQGHTVANVGMDARQPTHCDPDSHRVRYHPAYTGADVLPDAKHAGRKIPCLGIHPSGDQDVPVVVTDHRCDPALLHRELRHFCPTPPAAAMSTTCKCRGASPDCDRSIRSAAISNIAAERIDRSQSGEAPRHLQVVDTAAAGGVGQK